MAIESVLLHTNRNAPVGANEVYLYNTAAAKELTLGQLIAAVCIRAGAVLERQSVAKMNLITDGDAVIEDLADKMESIAENTVGNWGAMKTALEKNGVVGLPDDLDSFNKRLQAMAAIKHELEERSQVAQEDMIDLQTLINRRDVAHSTSTNLIRALGQSSINMATALIKG